MNKKATLLIRKKRNKTRKRERETVRSTLGEDGVIC
jgi:hypothetical protein